MRSLVARAGVGVELAYLVLTALALDVHATVKVQDLGLELGEC